jgi:hypothetical protein
MKKMLRFKKALRLFTLLMSGVVMEQTVSAQVPQTFNYQGIARDAGGNVLPNRRIGVELSVLDGGPTGTVVYSETFTDTTNAFGLFSMPVGGGTVVSGSFAGINWAIGNKYLQTAIDLSGGTSYSLSGTTQLLSVPYALYAQNAVVGASSNSWNLYGNANTGDTGFIGTTDLSILRFKTRDSISGIIDAFDQNTSLGYLTFDQAYGGNLIGNSHFLGNVAVGENALQNATGGDYNVAVGAAALLMTNGGSSGNGTGNVGIGYVTLQNNVAGNFNTAVGYGALQTNVSGTNNTAIGLEADMGSDGLTNATALGANAIVTASNMVQIGSTSVTTIQGQVPFTTPSDGRFKFNVREDVKGLDFILKLRPVTYQFNTKKQEDFIKGVQTAYEPAAYDAAMMVRRTGFIAQEVEKAAVSSGYDFDGLKVPKTDREYYSLSYASFVVPLVKAVQEQEGVIREQEQRIDDLSKQVEELRKMILAVTQK